MTFTIIAPADIEATSMGIIRRELAEQGIVVDDDQKPVILRVIHTSADFDYVRNLVFSPQAVGRAIQALQSGTPIITDTNMAKAGVNSKALVTLGSACYCYMAEASVAQEARHRGVTRATVAMERAAAKHPLAIFAVGNAPTALISLCELIDQGLRPALVIGVPVGFVNVVESKKLLMETCEQHDVPFIVSLGRKGGSTIAAAICNALLYEAAGMGDPQKRFR